MPIEMFLITTLLIKQLVKRLSLKYLLVKAPAPTGGGYSISDQFNDYKAGVAMNQMKEINDGLAAGTLAKGFDQKGDAYYYDSKAYTDAVTAFNAEVESRKNDWILIIN